MLAAITCAEAGFISSAAFNLRGRVDRAAVFAGRITTLAITD
jgi:hypothetical protein